MLAIALHAGCGGGEESDGPASLAPPDAPLFAQVEIQPDGDQAAALETLSGRLAGIEDPGAAIVAELDSELAADGDEIRYGDDIEPWIGSQAGIFVRSFEETTVVDGVPDFAVAIEARDPDRAREFLADALASDPEPEQERTYLDREYWFAHESGGLASGLVGDYLVVGTEASFKVAVDAYEGESLAQSKEYAERVGALPEPRVLTVFAEPGPAIEAALMEESMGADERRLLRPLLGGPLAQPVAAALTATDSAAGLDAVTAAAPHVSDAAGSVGRLPAGSWLALGTPQAGAAMRELLDQLEHGGLPGGGAAIRELEAHLGIQLRRDLLAWLEDAALFVKGAAPPGLTAGVLAGTSDSQGPRRLVARLQAIAERDSGLGSTGTPAGAEYGFSLGLPGFGGGAEAGVVAGDHLALVFGGTVESVVEPSETLAGDEVFRAAAEALGGDFEPNLFLRFAGLLDFAAANGAGADPGYRRAVPLLERLGSLIGGTRGDGDQIVSRWTLTVAGE